MISRLDTWDFAPSARLVLPRLRRGFVLSHLCSRRSGEKELGVETAPRPILTQAADDRCNYWAYLFEGGFFVFGMGFVNMQSLLPALILEEGGPSWVAAYMPTIMVIGLFGIPMLNAGWIDRLKQLKPFVKLTGFFQRVVYLVIGVVLVWGGLTGSAVWITLAAAPLLSGILGGVGFAAWQRLYMNSVPATKRASNLAFRFLIGGITGIVAGALIKWILGHYPGTTGYGLLHFCAAFLFFASWAMLFVVKEKPPEVEPEQESVAEPSALKEGVWTVLKRYFAPGPLRRSRRCFVGALFFMHAFSLVVPFYAVTLLTRLDQPKSFLGILAMWQMGGQSAGNLLAAAVGDRWGGRATFGFGLIAVCVTVAVAPFMTDPLHAQIAYAAFAMSMMVMFIGKDTLLMELSPEKGQSSYLAGMAMITMISLLLYGGIAQLLWSSLGGFNSLATVAIVLCVIAFGFLSFVEDPRGARINPLLAIRRGILRVFR